MIRNEIEISAPPATVWALTADVARWPELSPDTMRSVERGEPGSLAVGSTARIRQPAQPVRVWTVTRLDPERCFEWATTVAGATMTARHLLEPTPQGGCRNTLEVEVTGRGAGLIGRLVRRPIAKAIAKENLGFKQAAEDAPRVDERSATSPLEA
ncbi:SRPBCC family protein [Rhabdothermincola salaria]|uniref:SRPBCC family protein n=1 Tax=Rhabdothermincola salaria TaxID=2903142 RepID=UPI001E423E7C|nr:SRPBCC family protein [Rhabdothermincola salaria]MCD9623958.1 SRPBCC family protein [Rhabdothermincola salaria]